MSIQARPAISDVMRGGRPRQANLFESLESQQERAQPGQQAGQQYLHAVIAAAEVDFIVQGIAHHVLQEYFV